MKDFFKIFVSYLLGFATAVIFLIIFIVYLIIQAASFTKTTVDKNGYLLISLNKEIIEKPIDETFGSSKQIDLYSILNAINVSKFDDKIKGIIINGDNNYLSKEHIYELYEVIKDFKENSKKEVYCWFSSGDSNTYMLALLADKIYMPETDSSEFSIDGYKMVTPYYKDLFDKVGLGFSVIHIGDFKGSGDNLVEKGMNPQLRNHYISVLDDLYNNKISFISNLRGFDKSKIDQLIKDGKTIFLSSKDAKNLNLIDGFYNYDQFIDSVTGNYSTINIEDYIKTISKTNHKNKIAIVYADGVITNGLSGDDFYEGSIVGSQTMISDLDEIEKDASIKAVIIRVNSPGGSALASELIYQKIKKLKETKKVYISMGSLAASGGYYISCAGDKIFTTPFTITGSIGVVSIMMNYSKLSKNLGINFETIKKYKYDDIYSMEREPTNDEIELIKKSSLKIYKEFTSHIIENRKIDVTQIENIAQGRIWSGTQAIQIGLADAEGGLFSTIREIVKDSEIDKYSIVQYPKPENIFEKLKKAFDVRADIKLFKKIGIYKDFYEMYILSKESKLQLYLPFCSFVN